MKIKNIFKTAALSVCLFASQVMAWAQKKDPLSVLNEAPSKIKDMAEPIINIVLILVGILGVGLLAWAYAKKKKGDANANDGLMDVGWTTILVVGGLYVFKMIFF